MDSRVFFPGVVLIDAKVKELWSALIVLILAIGLVVVESRGNTVKTGAEPFYIFHSLTLFVFQL